jgi:TolB protein
MRKLTTGAVLALVAALLGLGGAANAARMTVPGKNGEVAFRRYLDARKTWGAIFTVNSDGEGERQVTHPPKGTVDDQPDWAPDGSSIVFSRASAGGAGAIYTVRPNGSGLRRLSAPCPSSTNCEDDYLAVFLPDGRHIAFSSFNGNGTGASIVVMDIQGRNRRVAVTGTKHAAYGEPQAAPDGAQLLFTRTSEPGEKQRAILVAAADGTGAHQITPWSLNAGDNPDWSPNGRWILFHSHDGDGKQPQIYVVHPDGSGLHQLTHFKPGTIVTSSSFSPDGKWIVLGSTGLGGNADLYVMHADGSGMHPLTRTRLWDSAPDWGPAP